jgi:uncharacterized protein (TIGR02646 family)
MVELDHSTPEPASLAAHRSAFPHGPWSTLPQAIKAEVRHQLNVEQDGLCVYCETSLDPESGHVEHIKSRDGNQDLIFVYDNLAHSCAETSHCGHFKGHNVIPLEPRPGVNHHFVLSEITGQLNPDFSLAETRDAATTLNVLGLNTDPGLNRQRQQYAVTVRALSDQEADVADFLTTAPFRWSLRRIF